MKINIQAPINQMGYGIAGYNILKALVDLGHEVAFFPIDGIGSIQLPAGDYRWLQQTLENRNNYDNDAPSVRIWHQFDLALHVGYGRKIVFPFFELNKFSEVEKHHLEGVDEILVASHWAKFVINSELGFNSKVVPLGVDRSIFHENVGSAKDHPTNFLNIGKWEIRKGHDFLVDAFNAAFTPSDDVCLYMMCDNPFREPSRNNGVDGNLEWQTLYKSGPMADKIQFIPRVENHAQVAHIMGAMDCGVFPSRAEGWNLEALEMLSCGKQLIITDYSAHTEFCNNENAFMIDIDALEPAFELPWFNGHVGNWAALGEKQLEQTVEHMRTVHKNRQLNEKGIETAKHFTWENTAKRLAAVAH